MSPHAIFAISVSLSATHTLRYWLEGLKIQGLFNFLKFLSTYIICDTDKAQAEHRQLIWESVRLVIARSWV